MNKLVIQDDEGKTTVVPLIREEITIGRKEGNTIRLTERNVSRRHARIMRNNGHVQIEDLDSYNGVRVNGSRIQGRCQLAVSDRVQIGDYLIELKADAAEQGVDPYGEQRTQPIERVDPAAPTPRPAPAAPEPGAPTAVVNVNRIQGTAQPPAFPGALANTDPVGAPVAAPAVAEAPSAAGTARLVVLSSNFAGREFDLSKPAMVIGRTDENDIVINHRSISRHHAKVVHENGRFAIVDLQSSNGVRVNGEEYGKVELRRGDMVDLGHVRMRFVDVGEDFVFGRDAQAVDIGPAGSKKGLVIGIAAVMLIGGLIAFVATRGGSGDDRTTAASGDGDNVPAVAKTDGDKTDDGDKPDGTDDGDTTDGTDGADKTDDAAMALLERAQVAIHEEKWADAKATAKKVLADDPSNAAAKQLLDQANKELANSKIYDRFKKAAGKKNYKAVRANFDAIDDTSVYKDQARDEHDRIRDEYVEVQEARAAKLAAANKCKDLRKLAAQADKVWPEAGAAVRNHESDCRTAVAMKDPTPKPKKPKVKKPKVKKPAVKKPKKPPVAAGSGKSAAELTSEARSAAKTGHWGKALRLCESALSKQRGNQDAAMVCALAACNIKSASKAKRYIGKLRSGARKGMARQSCLKNGVDVPID